MNMFFDVSNIDPVAIEFGFLQIKWYGLAYVVGLLGAFSLSKYLAKKYKSEVSPKQIDDFFVWAVLGVVIGGRLGYTLFYQPSYYLSNPLEILYIMNGGMSFHGGGLGVLVAFILYCKKHKISLLAFMDIFSVSTPIGLFLGRIANFINGELWGRETDGSWGFYFAGTDIPRHPSQLYEAFGEGLLLLFILMLMVTRYDALKTKGLVAGTFIMLYGVARIFVEFFREPDVFIGYLSHQTTLGQWLSVPLVIFGTALIRKSLR